MYIRPFTFVIVLVALVLAACDNPVEDHEHEPVEAVGLALFDGQQEILRVEDAQASDTLAVSLGGGTPVLEVVFLNDHGEEIHGEDFDEEYSLQWEITDEDIVSLESEGRWSFTAHGESAGETTVQLQLFHGGHDDLKADVPVRVE